MSTARRSFVLAAAVLSGVARAVPPELPPVRVDVDPMKSPVPPPPPFRSGLDEAEYAKRYAAAVARLGPPPAADGPTVGVSVEAVSDGSAAATAGLRAGDVIVGVDGHHLDGGAADLQRLRAGAKGPQALSVLNAGKTRSVSVPPGELGVQVSDDWLLESQYVHDLPAGVVPAEQVRVAMQCAQSDPALAEAALAHATGAAAAGPVVDLVASQAAALDGRFDDALAYAMAARGAVPAGRVRVVELMAVPLAVATFRWPLAKTLGTKDEVVLGMIDPYEARPHVRPEADPVSAHVHFKPRLADLTNVTPNDGPKAQSLWTGAEYYCDTLRRGGKVAFNAPDASRVLMLCGPTDADLDFWGRYHYAMNRQTQHRFGRVVEVGIGDVERPAVQLSLLQDGLAEVQYSWHSVVRLNLASLVGSDRRFTVRMTVAGDRIEFTIDGRRVFYGPLPPDLADEAGRQLPPLHLQFVGVKGQVTDAHYRTAAARSG